MNWKKCTENKISETEVRTIDKVRMKGNPELGIKEARNQDRWTIKYRIIGELRKNLLLNKCFTGTESLLFLPI